MVAQTGLKSIPPEPGVFHKTEAELRAAKTARNETEALLAEVRLRRDRTKALVADNVVSQAELDSVLSEVAASLRHLAMLVYPFMPERAGAMAAALGLEDDPSVWVLDDLTDASRAPRQVSKSEALFPRFDADEIIDGES